MCSICFFLPFFSCICSTRLGNESEEIPTCNYSVYRVPRTELRTILDGARNISSSQLRFVCSLFFSFTECRCNPYGSLNRSCDKYTGQCFCRGNVTGRTCDKCIDGFWDLQASRGCVNCQCNPIGSRDSNCSQYTGQCNCKPGVGGLSCDVCLDGFYGLSIQGCKSNFPAQFCQTQHFNPLSSRSRM